MTILAHARITEPSGRTISAPFISDNEIELFLLDKMGKLKRTIAYDSVKNWSGVEISVKQFKSLISKNN